MSPRSPETKAKISVALKKRLALPENRIKLEKFQFRDGHRAWNKGRSLSADHRNRISESNKGRISPNKGKAFGPYSLERRAKLSESHKGQKPWNLGLTKETAPGLRIVSEKRKGHPGYYLGKRFSAEHRANMSGNRNGRWKGGLSFEPYMVEFNGILKDKIRLRDGYRCQLCGVAHSKLSVHHIDYNKQNNELANLIALCRSCHSKTNEQRDYWREYLGSIIRQKVYSYACA